ncbi:MAG: glucose-6-phosphate isomerase [Gemmatimonadetes bacterium]|nr:glucose-6-phosphate isomerase [Gemmatimonadota bacterium]
MPERLALDYNHMLSPRLGEARGIDPARLDALAERFRAVHAEVRRRREAGELGFFDPPYDTAILDEVRKFGDGLGQAFETIVVLGIGGSARGAIALRDALVAPFWNELDDDARSFYPKLYILDTIDPATIGPFLDRLDLGKTLFNVVSKSGSTAETMARFLIVRDRLAREFDGDGVRRHLLFTTDPEEGALRRIARDERIATLPIPPNVAGRFSVFTPVGLLPAALVGGDVARLLEGARDMDRRCATDVLADNPAGLFATLQHLADTDKGASIQVMAACCDRLYATADWFRQLWAESLGKRTNRAGDDVFVGPTPVAARGATDAHAQLQLWLEGPFDKTVTFLAVRDLDEDVEIPAGAATDPALAYLGGRTLGELLRAGRLATARALAERGRMNMTIELPRLDAHALGQLLMMLQIATVYAAELYGVDPLDQPGVERGKQLADGLMGRPGFAAPEASPPDPRFTSR